MLSLTCSPFCFFSLRLDVCKCMILSETDRKQQKRQQWVRAPLFMGWGKRLPEPEGGRKGKLSCGNGLAFLSGKKRPHLVLSLSLLCSLPFISPRRHTHTRRKAGVLNGKKKGRMDVWNIWAGLGKEKKGRATTSCKHHKTGMANEHPRPLPPSLFPLLFPSSAPTIRRKEEELHILILSLPLLLAANRIEFG